MEVILAVVVVVWIICGVLAYGLCFAYFQRRFPSLAERGYIGDLAFAVFAGLLGPLGLLIELSLGGIEYGLKFK